MVFKKCFRGQRNPWVFVLADPSLAEESAASGTWADLGKTVVVQLFSTC